MMRWIISLRACVLCWKTQDATPRKTILSKTSSKKAGGRARISFSLTEARTPLLLAGGGGATV